jgi:hypothetical protein
MPAKPMTTPAVFCAVSRSSANSMWAMTAVKIGVAACTIEAMPAAMRSSAKATSRLGIQPLTEPSTSQSCTSCRSGQGVCPSHITQAAMAMAARPARASDSVQMSTSPFISLMQTKLKPQVTAQMARCAAMNSGVGWPCGDRAVAGWLTTGSRR